MSYGLYLHWPFCRRKCPYCAFVSFPFHTGDPWAYADALHRELEMRRTGNFSIPPSTVYLGGGTPSLIPPECIPRIFEDIVFPDGIEFTAEGNPESLSESWLTALKKAGANRISLGLQSLDDRLLAGLGRQHSSRQGVDAVRKARASGFENLSIDLMFGIPGQTIEQWRETLAGALELEPDHISGYSLGIERDTPFSERVRKGGFETPDADVTARMYLFMSDMLREKGYHRYEISNFAIPGRECSHNRNYWNFTPYLGVGASAHSFDGSRRWWNTADLEKYTERVRSGHDPMEGNEVIDSCVRAAEELMLSLRTSDGLAIGEFITQYPIIRDIFFQKVESLENAGLLAEIPQGNLILTDRGVMIADEIITEFLVDFPVPKPRSIRKGKG